MLILKAIFELKRPVTQKNTRNVLFLINLNGWIAIVRQGLHEIRVFASFFAYLMTVQQNRALVGTEN